MAISASSVLTPINRMKAPEKQRVALEQSRLPVPECFRNDFRDVCRSVHVMGG